MLEVGKDTFLSGFQIHTLGYITTIVTDTEVSVFSGFELDHGTSLGTDTTAEDVACILEVACLIVAVTDSPTLFYKARESLRPEPCRA